MIKVNKTPDGYVINYGGPKQDFKYYAYKLSKISKKRFSSAHRGWLVPTLDEIKQFFEIPVTEQEVEVTDYDDIGKSMKLQPYPYQKEAIKFCLDTLNALLVLPCGSGRFYTLLCL